MVSTHRNWGDWTRGTQAPGQVTLGLVSTRSYCYVIRTRRGDQSAFRIPAAAGERELTRVKHLGPGLSQPSYSYGWELVRELPSMGRELPNWARPLCHHPSENVNMLITGIVTPSVTRETALSHNNYLFRI